MKRYSYSTNLSCLLLLSMPGRFENNYRGHALVDYSHEIPSFYLQSFSRSVFRKSQHVLAYVAVVLFLQMQIYKGE